MSLDTITLDDALQLLSLPRVVGVDEDGEEVTARNGRYGPYVQKGKESRSLETEEQLLTIDPRAGARACSRSRASAAARRRRAGPLKELGTDPGSGKPIVVKYGRFGPYVTDGETNASLRQGDDPEEITQERALELLAERRAKGPAEEARRRRSQRSTSTKAQRPDASRLFGQTARAVARMSGSGIATRGARFPWQRDRISLLW